MHKFSVVEGYSPRRWWKRIHAMWSTKKGFRGGFCLHLPISQCGWTTHCCTALVVVKHHVVKTSSLAVRGAVTFSTYRGLVQCHRPPLDAHRSCFLLLAQLFVALGVRKHVSARRLWTCRAVQELTTLVLELVSRAQQALVLCLAPVQRRGPLDVFTSVRFPPKHTQDGPPPCFRDTSVRAQNSKRRGLGDPRPPLVRMKHHFQSDMAKVRHIRPFLRPLGVTVKQGLLFLEFRWNRALETTFPSPCTGVCRLILGVWI